MSAPREPSGSDSIALFDELAVRGYDDHFAVAHRRAYDDLAWDTVAGLLPDRPATVVDAGCGAARWAARLVALGHRVVGIEQAPAMIAAARARQLPADRFVLVEGDMSTVVHPELRDGGADVVLAMGSVQYATAPAVTIARLAAWAAPGGAVAVLTDSLVALVLELLAAGRVTEAIDRASSGRGTWRTGAGSADLHLFDRVSLAAAMAGAGLADVVVRGLLVGWSGFGGDGLVDRLAADRAAALDCERALAGVPALADAGKQLLAVGRRP